MIEPRWLAVVHIVAIHSDQIQAHGGSLGLRDRGLLESALERPRNRFRYDPDTDLPALAAAYGFGLSNNHPFLDGNKRVAFQAMYLFLGCINAETVQPEEKIHGLEGDALVPVHKGVVVREAKTIGCSKGGEVRVRVVVEPVTRTFDGRLQETPVSKSEGATVSFDLIRMDGEDVYESEPPAFDHLASSRMALR